VGCAVLVMDQLGHGERRQHPFRTAADYPERFAVGRQEYWFRYNTALPLYFAGESLMGWMVNDLMCGVDLLVARPDVDAKKIVLLGSVAGGGDPAAVTAALDERIAAVVPFNFGGPQPETRYPLPADAEESFNYAGSGSWESTRNLRLSVRDGFLPWVIVTSVAPRRLVYAHEFSWDRERDPVWRRLETVYRWYDASEHLAYTQGRGTLRGGAPEDTHCNNIGPVHREGIHAALAKWFGIETPDEKRPRERRSAEELRCMTDEVAAEAKPLFARELAAEIVGKRLASSRTQRITLSAGERTSQLRKHLGVLLGNVDEPARDGVTARTVGQLRFGAWPVRVDRVELATERRIAVPLALVLPTGKERAVPAVVAFCQAGKQRWLKERAGPVAEFLRRGVAVCIVDVRGMGETSLGDGRGRTSAAASLAADEWMLGQSIVAGQLRDLLATLTYLRKCPEIDSRRIALWGDSLAAPNPSDAVCVTPHNIDVKLRSPEPGAGLLALLAALYDNSIVAVATGGAVHSFQSVFDSPVCRIPPDAIVPGLLTVADVPDLVAALAPRPIRLTTTVDAHNRLVSRTQILNAWKSMPGSDVLHHADVIASDGALDATATARWLADKLQIANKKQ
jgi:cephalosporin-C deacetylase-like acetyl esterase